MNLPLSSLLALSLLAPAASADELVFQKIKFRQDRGPAAQPKKPAVPQEVLDRLKSATDIVDSHSADPISPADWDRATDAALKAMVKELKIPHSSYMTEKEFETFKKSMANASFGGVGMELQAVPEGIKVSPLPNSPAEKAGIDEGDVVTAVDGKDVSALSLEDVVTLIRGPKGTPVSLTVKKGAAAPVVIRVTRATIIQNNSFRKMIGTDVGYVYFRSFGDKGVTDVEVSAHIDALLAQGARKLVMDLRFNPGGSVPTVGEIASWFLRDGQTVVNFKRQGQVETFGKVVNDGKYLDLPLVVLINGGSASASEIMAAAMQDHKRAVVVGSRSFGKGSAQSLIPTDIAGYLGGPSPAVKITSSKWFSPNDRSIQGAIDPKTGYEAEGTGGVVPDVEIAATKDEVKDLAREISKQLAGRPGAGLADPALDRAVQILRALP